jgi:cellulose biosynthesis protein BcsQ
VLVKGDVWESGEEEHPIFKYQSAVDILREIFSRYSDEEKQSSYVQVHKGKAKMIAVYSPIHRVGKSTFAMALARAYAAEKKTLYLNLEEYAGEVLEDGGGLGEILYYMRQGDKNLRMRIDALAHEKEGYYYLLPIELSEDLKDICVAEWLALFRELLATSGYERVILDIGDSVQGLFDILELCDCVYMPVLRDEISERKLRRFEQNLNRMQLENLPKQICRFIMPENIEEYAKMRKREDT